MEAVAAKMSASDLELLIDDYVDGSLDPAKRNLVEARMKADADFREKVETATQSISLIRQALSKVEPGRDFEEKVNSQIISITQSNQHLRPFNRGAGGQLTARDPDARLLHDPEAAREKRRLMGIAAAAAVLFAIAAATLVILLSNPPSEKEKQDVPAKPPAAQHR